MPKGENMQTCIQQRKTRRMHLYENPKNIARNIENGAAGLFIIFVGKRYEKNKKPSSRLVLLEGKKKGVKGRERAVSLVK